MGILMFKIYERKSEGCVNKFYKIIIYTSACLLSILNIYALSYQKDLFMASY